MSTTRSEWSVLYWALRDAHPDLQDCWLRSNGDWVVYLKPGLINATGKNFDEAYRNAKVARLIALLEAS